MSDNEYPDEYLDENGNEYQEEKPEQERGELKPCPFCEKEFNTGHHPDCYFRVRGKSDDDRETAWQSRPVEDALRAENTRLTAELAALREKYDEKLTEEMNEQR